MPEGTELRTEEGTPQGGPLSPLLSNIVLDELDQELHRRGHRFVRYADDANIFVKSERAGERVKASITRFIEKRLRLKVNLDESAVAKPETRSFLGVTLNLDPESGKARVTVSKDSRDRIRSRLEKLTPRSWGRSMRDCIDQLNQYLRGTRPANPSSLVDPIRVTPWPSEGGHDVTVSKRGLGGAGSAAW